MKPAIVAIIAIAAGGIGFFGGMTYQKSKQPNLTQGGFAQMRLRDGNTTGAVTGNQTQRRNGFGGGMTTGEVTAMDDKSITVKSPDGSSKIVILSGATKYSESKEASASGLKVGGAVAIFGTANTDGSITASSVQLNPEMRNLAVPAPGNMVVD